MSQKVVYRRSKSKLSQEGSPYLEPIIRTKKSFTNIPSLSSKRHTFTGLTMAVTEANQERSRKSDKIQKRYLADNSMQELLEMKKAKELEELLNERLEQFSAGMSEWISEIDVIDSIYAEIMKFFQHFAGLLQTLRSKLESFVCFSVKEKFSSQIQKVVKKNENLIVKINNLSNLHSQVVKENEEIKKKQKDYHRIFESDPNFLINYQNIVDQMIEQVDIIQKLQRENKKLKEKEHHQDTKIAYMEKYLNEE